MRLIGICLLAWSSLMGEIREVESIQKPSDLHMVGDGFHVLNYFTSQSPNIQNLSPFLLLDYNAPHSFPATPGYLKGVGPHPHRGFETVTIVYEGALAHRDSTGKSGIIGPGDVQWMTAASGILHEEFHEKQFSDNGGTLHAVQLWVNLPASQKMSLPKYQTLLKDSIPSVDLRNGFLRVIAGNYAGTKGAASTFSEMNVWDIQLNKNGEATLTIPAQHNALLLVTQGSVDINAHQATFKDLVHFKNGGETVHVKALQDSKLLLLSGVPLNEPIAGEGPFVMTNRQELRQAFKDFNSGKFGHLD